jgi:hypothetical protein
MARKALMRVAVLTVVGILGSAGTALAWNFKGEQNGWDNKNVRGCPTSYSPVAASENPIVDLNGDGTICGKTMSNGDNYVDNISNH